MQTYEINTVEVGCKQALVAVGTGRGFLQEVGFELKLEEDLKEARGQR